MRTINKNLIVLLISISMVCLSSCAGVFGGDDYVLNDRQKVICEEVGLPTDYNELEDYQKESIRRIEEMLQYLEHKYGCTFIYHGYIDGGMWAQLEGEEETLYAYAEGQNPEDLTEVTVGEDGEFEDTYMWYLVRDIYQEAAEDYLKKETGNENIKVFAISGDTKIKNEDEINKNNLAGKCWGVCDIFVFGNYSDEQIIDIANLYTEYMVKNKFFSSNTIYFGDDLNLYERLNQENYYEISKGESFRIVYCSARNKDDIIVRRTE